MSGLVDVICPKCGDLQMHLEADVAAHDDGLLDIVLTCSECRHCLNAFVSVSEMMVVES